MTFDTFFPLFENHFATALKLQEQANTLGQDPKTGHGILARATCFNEFSKLIDTMCAIFNANSPDHWADLKLEVRNDCFEKTSRLVLDIPTLKQNPDHTSLPYIFGLLCAATNITTLPEEDQIVWDTLQLPQRLQTLHRICIKAGKNESFDAFSLGDAVGQSIISFNFWDETIFDDTHTIHGSEDVAFYKGYTNTENHLADYLTDNWDAADVFLDFLAGSNVLTDNAYYSLCSDTRHHLNSWSRTKGHDFLAQLADVVRQIPNGGRWGGYFVSPNYEEGDGAQGESIVYARNAQHALAIYLVEQSLTFFDDVEYHDFSDFTVRKLSTERNVYQNKEDLFLV